MNRHFCEMEMEVVLCGLQSHSQVWPPDDVSHQGSHGWQQALS